MLGKNHVSTREHQSPQYALFEFADIAGPRVLVERAGRIGGEPKVVGVSALLPANDAREKKGKVDKTFAQRRQGKREAIEPRQQVVAKMPLCG